ncbi:adenylyl-sulfate kinase [Granulicella arctica]|uniref:adenylyl-sulfate kinase n=1 Tax=Granulicella arctica TaxID=940613 RepID=UPI0021DFD390|nr:adenylyl-sulfate kinase [Granulicella arctica]
MTSAESGTLHPGVIIWFTGLSGAGKTTLCRCIAQTLSSHRLKNVLLDGDEIRATISSDLGFTRTDREENMCRLAALASFHALQGVIVLVAAIAPYRGLREHHRSASPVPFLEAFVDAPLTICEARDPKGLYRAARAGTIQRFTGIGDVYEPPLHPDIHCCTSRETITQSCLKVLDALRLVVLPLQLPTAALSPTPAVERRVADTLPLPFAPVL